MQKKRAVVLQQEWGGKPCDHPAFAKEYDLGERTGNHICTQCGKTGLIRIFVCEAWTSVGDG